MRAAAYFASGSFLLILSFGMILYVSRLLPEGESLTSDVFWRIMYIGGGGTAVGIGAGALILKGFTAMSINPKDSLLTLGFLLLFSGAMTILAASTFITSGGVTDPKYVLIGQISAIGTVIGVLGSMLVVKYRG